MVNFVLLNRRFKPPVGPLVDHNFEGGVLPPEVYLARLSSATYFDASRIMQTAGNNVARFDHDPVTGVALGILVEAQRTNSVSFSRPTAATWDWFNNAPIGEDFILAPDGSVTMAPMLEGYGIGEHSLDGKQYIQYEDGQPYAWSIFAKAGTATALQIFTQNGKKHANFNLLVGTIGASSGLNGSMKAVGNGIYRCIAVDPAFSGTGYNPAIKIALIDNDLDLGYAPDYGYAGENKSLYIWGAMREEGDSATSLVDTDNSIETRAADQLSFTIPSGVSTLRYVFDDNSTQDVSAAPGSYTVPTNLNRSHIKRIFSI